MPGLGLGGAAALAGAAYGHQKGLQRGSIGVNMGLM